VEWSADGLSLLKSLQGLRPALYRGGSHPPLGQHFLQDTPVRLVVIYHKHWQINQMNRMLW